MVKTAEREYYARCPDCGEIVYADQRKWWDDKGIIHHSQCHEAIVVDEEIFRRQTEARKRKVEDEN